MDTEGSLFQHTYDIRTTDMAYQWKLEESFGVKMTAEDEVFHYDNCYGSYIEKFTVCECPKYE